MSEENIEEIVERQRMLRELYDNPENPEGPVYWEREIWKDKSIKSNFFEKDSYERTILLPDLTYWSDWIELSFLNRNNPEDIEGYLALSYNEDLFEDLPDVAAKKSLLEFGLSCLNDATVVAKDSNGLHVGFSRIMNFFSNNKIIFPVGPGYVAKDRREDLIYDMQDFLESRLKEEGRRFYHE